MSSMLEFAALCESIGATTKKTLKRQLLERYFISQDDETSAIAAIFLSGRPFAAYEERTLQVGGNLLWRLIAEITGAEETAMAQAYRRHGDLGAAAAEVLGDKASSALVLSLKEVRERFDTVANVRGPSAKQRELRELLVRCNAVEIKYIVKIVTGDLRIGLRGSLVEEAIATAFSAPVEQVRRANMLLGDIGETLRLARNSRLVEAKMRLFHPIGFMLASPADTVAEAFSSFSEMNIHVEDKYDGIRAQVHCGDPSQPGRVQIFSRTLDNITGSFPELVPFFATASESIVLDGEIVAWEMESGADQGRGGGRALPFSELQARLGRKQVTPELLRSVPVAFVCFDVLFARDQLVIDQPLRDRARLLDEIAGRLLANGSAPRPAVNQPQQTHMFAEREWETEDLMPVPAFLRAPVMTVHSAHELELLFDRARARGNEGLMIKDLASAYTPGRRGSAWLKLKRELATLDVAITAAEYGHGRRSQWLSDYTFAIRDGERLRNVGKAYSGVTDEEIKELTAWCKEHTLVDYGHARTVSPEIVLEVAFNNVMISDRHDSGFALRFPRIVRIRRDKKVEDIDTIERVQEIFERQGKLLNNGES